MRNSSLEVYDTTDERTNEGGGGWTLNLFLSTSSSDYPRTGVLTVTTTQHPEIASVDTDTILKKKKKTGILFCPISNSTFKDPDVIQILGIGTHTPSMSMV